MAFKIKPAPPKLRGHGCKYNRQMENAVTALLTSKNVGEAAASVKITPATLLRWMKEPEFDRYYRESRQAAFGQSVSRLAQASSAAVTTLLMIMVDKTNPASVRVRAADSVLVHARHGIEIEDLNARIKTLEDSLQLQDSF